ncbi:starch-binding protein, partial [bacterium]|nr:starch-binding protein [bacterium]
MGKSIKRIYTLLCMVAMFVMMIPSMAFAAEADETKVAINVKVPDDWQNPCVWVPDWANHVIVNANAGEVQTGELVLDGKDAWITVSDADNTEVSYDAQTTGDTPEYTEKFLIHAKVDDSWENPNLWAWSAPDGTNAFASWPGEALEENNGWLTKEIPGWVNSIIVNGNDGSVQTSDISIETEKDVWVVVTDAENYEVTYEEP